MSVKGQFVRDMRAFLRDFGEDAVLNNTRVIRAVLDNDYQAALGIENANPVAHVSAEQGNVIAVNDQLAFSAKTYTVGNKKPDGTGLIILELIT